MNYLKHPERTISHLISIPFIWGMLIPIVLLDIMVEIYHQICFRLYKLPRVSRKEYIQIDRQRLSYLDPIQKINCMYCGYVNGLFYYFVRIANVTESYWCGIKHEKVPQRKNQIHQQRLKFLDFGNEQAYLDLKHGDKS